MALVSAYGMKKITKEILDNIQEGNKVHCNDWGRKAIVTGVSEHYIVLDFEDTKEYSILEKKPSEYSRNLYHKGNFRIGPSDYIFMPYDTSNKDDIEKLLNELECGDTQLSTRYSIDLQAITVYKG